MKRCEHEHGSSARRNAGPTMKRWIRIHRREKHRHTQGIALVWTAIVLIVMVGVLGLSIDWGKVVWNAHEIQNATDAAALAGAQIVKTDPIKAVLRTRDFAMKNWADQLPVTLQTTPQPEPFVGNASAFDILVGRWVRYNQTFVPTLDAPTAVRAIARREAAQGAQAPPLKLVFGPIFGTDTVDAAREAVAWCNDSSASGFLCLSSSATPGLYLSGSADVDVDGGGIHVNSTTIGRNSNDGAWVSGSTLLDCGFINVVGGITPPPDSSDWVNIFKGGNGMVQGFPVCDYSDGVTHIDDPLAKRMLLDGDPYVDPVTGDHLELPDLIQNGTFPTRQAAGDALITASCSLAPGYYPYGIRLTTAGETVTLDPTLDPTVPPIYIFGGGRPSDPACGMYVNGGNLIGFGVTCYVTKSYGFGETWGVTRLMGNGTVRLVSPGDNAIPQDLDGLSGIAVWQDPANPNFAHLNGGGNFGIDGVLYFPDPIHVKLEGDLGQAGNQILCGSAEILGKAVISVDYDNRNNSAPSNTAFLVK